MPGLIFAEISAEFPQRVGPEIGLVDGLRGWPDAGRRGWSAVLVLAGAGDGPALVLAGAEDHEALVIILYVIMSYFFTFFFLFLLSLS